MTDANPWLLAVASLVTLAVTARAFADEPPRRRLGSVLLASLDTGHHTSHRSSVRTGVENLHARLVGVRRSREARLFPLQAISTPERVARPPVEVVASLPSTIKPADSKHGPAAAMQPTPISV